MKEKNLFITPCGVVVVVVSAESHGMTQILRKKTKTVVVDKKEKEDLVHFGSLNYHRHVFCYSLRSQ